MGWNLIPFALLLEVPPVVVIAIKLISRTEWLISRNICGMSIKFPTSKSHLGIG